MKTKARILVIEDEPEVSRLMALALTRAGCEVEAAADGDEGVRRAEEGDFDLISTDVDLPALNGFEVCRRLKQNPKLRHTPVILVTARSAQEDEQRGRDAGAVDYITKPFDLLEFIPQVLSHIKRRSDRTEAQVV